MSQGQQPFNPALYDLSPSKPEPIDGLATRDELRGQLSNVLVLAQDDLPRVTSEIASYLSLQAAALALRLQTRVETKRHQSGGQRSLQEPFLQPYSLQSSSRPTSGPPIKKGRFRRCFLALVKEWRA